MASLSFNRLSSLLSSKNIEIINVYTLNSNPHNIIFLELKSEKYFNTFFVRLGERFDMKTTSDVGHIITPCAIPSYKDGYIRLLSQREDQSQKETPPKSEVLISQDYIIYISKNITAYEFSGEGRESPKKDVALPKDDVISQLESELGELDDHVPVNEDEDSPTEVSDDSPSSGETSFREITELVSDPFIVMSPEKEHPLLELIDDAGEEIPDVSSFVDTSPIPVHMNDGTVLSYRPVDNINTFKGSNNKTSHRQLSINHPKLDSQITRDSYDVDVGDLYVCYDIDVFHSKIQEEDFELSLLQEYNDLYTTELELRDKQIEEIDSTLMKYKMSILSEIDDIRNIQNDLLIQMKRLVDIINACRNSQSVGDKKIRVLELQEKSKTTLKELYIEFIKKRDSAYSILKRFSNRVNNILST